MFARVFCLLLSCLFAVEAQFVIDRGERDVFRNLTGCSNESREFCYFVNAEESPLDHCVCRCKPKYPMYRNPDVSLSGGGDFISKKKPGCVWHSNHRYECFHIRKLGRGFHTSDDEGALEFDFRKPGSLLAYADHDLSRCTGLDTAIKMPEEEEFILKTGLMTATYGRFDVITFKWTAIAEKYDGGILRGVFKGCSGNLPEAERCFVGKISGIYNGGDCSVRALNGECCILPFTYEGQVYNNCTTADSQDSWCAVTLPFFGNETNWWKYCTNTSKINASTSPIQSSPTGTVSPTSTAVFPASETMILPTEVVSLQNSSIHLEPTPTLAATVETKKAIFGLTVVRPGPPLERTHLISEKYEPTSSTDVQDSVILHNMSTVTFKVSRTVDVPSISPYKLSPSSPVYQTSSVSDYNGAMVDYKSSVSNELTPSEFKVTTIGFTLSVSDQKPSVTISMSDHTSPIIGHVPSVTVSPERSIDYSQSTSDHSSSIIDHVSSPTIATKGSTIHYSQSTGDRKSSFKVSMSDHASSVIDYVLSVTLSPNRSIDYSQSTSDYKSSAFSHDLSVTDYQSTISDYIRSISHYQTAVSGSERTASTTSQYSYEYKPSLTGSVSSQIVLTAPITVMNSSVSSSIFWPTHKATESSMSTIAVIIVIAMGAVAFLVISLICLFFLFLKHRKNRIKSYGLIRKKQGNQAAQSPDSQRTDRENPSQSDIVTVEDNESEMAKTEFTIPEKNNHETSDMTNNKDCEPAYMTFRL